MPHDWIRAPGNAEEYYFKEDGKPVDNTRRFRQIRNGIWLDVGSFTAYVVGRYAPTKGTLQWHAQYTAQTAPMISIPHRKPSGSFNMIGRAEDTKPTAKLYYDPRRTSIEALGKKANVSLVPLTPNSLAKQEPSPGKMITRERFGGYKLSEELSSPRTPRSSPKVKRKTRPLDAVPGNIKKMSHQIYRHTRPGNEKPDRATAMGGWSADKYAAHVDPTWRESKWEWLHMVGHSVGGDNEPDNLVAGTFDANTAMIPFERGVMAEQSKLKLGESIQYDVTAILVPGTHVATSITVSVRFPKSIGRKDEAVTFQTTVNLKLTKIQYELITYDARRQSGGIYTDVGRTGGASTSSTPQLPIRRVQRVFKVHTATGIGNNCLLDTLNQLRKGVWVTDQNAVKTMRETLKAACPTIGSTSMLDIYGAEGLRLINDLQMRLCVVQLRDGNVFVGPVRGDPSDPLHYVMHQGAHFSPLELKPGMNHQHVTNL